jgi:hypothetical protein
LHLFVYPRVYLYIYVYVYISLIPSDLDFLRESRSVQARTTRCLPVLWRDFVNYTLERFESAERGVALKMLAWSFAGWNLHDLIVVSDADVVTLKFFSLGRRKFGERPACDAFGLRCIGEGSGVCTAEEGGPPALGFWRGGLV